MPLKEGIWIRLGLRFTALLCVRIPIVDTIFFFFSFFLFFFFFLGGGGLPRFEGLRFVNIWSKAKHSCTNARCKQSTQLFLVIWDSMFHNRCITISSLSNFRNLISTVSKNTYISAKHSGRWYLNIYIVHVL
jgi:hypothetical protein